MATQITIYIVATALTSVIWMIYVCYRTFPPHASVWLAQERPVLRHIMAALWVTSLLDLIAMLFITLVVLMRNYYGLGVVLENAPEYLGWALFCQYALFYVVGITPATVLFVAISSIKRIEKATTDGS